MSDSVLIDTDVLVDIARGVTAAMDFVNVIAARSTTIAISDVTEMELIAGCRNNAELNAMFKRLSDYARAHINERISENAVLLMHQYKLTYSLGIADALIAATALSMSANLLTRNIRHFQFNPDLVLLPFAP